MYGPPNDRGRVVTSIPLYSEESVTRLGQALALVKEFKNDDLVGSASSTWHQSHRYHEVSSGEEASDQSIEENPDDSTNKDEEDQMSNEASDNELRDTFDTEPMNMPQVLPSAMVRELRKHDKHQPSRVRNNEGELSISLIRKHFDTLSCASFDLPHENHTPKVRTVIELPLCLLSKEELLCDDVTTQCRAYQELSVAISVKERPVIVFFIRSGRFAGAVFVHGKCTRHRTSVRYTVRKGQGKAQSAQDGSQRRAISMGAQLRRQGEASLREDIRTTVLEWKEDIQNSALILVSIPRTMQKDLFENNQNILLRTDSRIRRVPLDLGRPTHENSCLIHTVLLTVVVRERVIPKSSFATVEDPQVGNSIANDKESSGGTLPIIDHEPALKEVPLTDLHLAAQKADVDKIISILDSSGDDMIYKINQPAGSLYKTPLHFAAESVSETSVDPGLAAECVRLLLERGKADPCCTDSRRRVPYFLASHDKVRDAFRIARANLGEDYCHWDEMAKVGPPLTQEIMDEKAEKEAEKRRKKRAKQKEKKSRDKAEEKAAEERRLAAENFAKMEEEARRIRHGLQPKISDGGVCDFCQTVCVGRKRANMFKRIDFSYCSTDCLQKHKRELMVKAALSRIGN